MARSETRPRRHCRVRKWVLMEQEGGEARTPIGEGSGLYKARRIMVAISGASGIVYARRLLEMLPLEYRTIYLTATENAAAIMREELGVESLGSLISSDTAGKFKMLDPSDMLAPPTSGSHDYEGLVVVPCSTGLLGRIVGGASDDLVTRAAEVCLKERRKLVLVVRETPLSLIHLRNMTTLAEAGAIVLPACPAFYCAPETVGEMVDFVVDRILRSLDVESRAIRGWCE
jgi:4-hydroxy-3-polyprenylbenzoate decarboxylase